MKNNLNELNDLVKSKRSYHWSYDMIPNQIHKTFNHGNGSLAIFEALPDEKILLVNECLANRSDYTNARAFFPDWEIEKVSLGYPDWYFKRSLKDCRAKA